MQGRPDKETDVHPKIVDIKDQRTGKDKGKHSQELGHRNTKDKGYRNTTSRLWKEKASQDKPHIIVSLPSVDCHTIHAVVVVLVLMLHGNHSTFRTIAINNYPALCMRKRG